MDVPQLINLYVKIQMGCFLMGLLGNTLAFIVFSRKTFRHNSINIYCRALAVFDSLIILVQFPNVISLLFYGIDLYSTSDSVCKFTNYASNFLPPMSAWILVMFSVDKLLCVSFPNRFEIIRKRWLQLGVIAALLVAHLAIYVIVPINLTVVKIPTVIVINGTSYTFYTASCVIQTLSFYRAINITYLVEANFLPFVIMIIASVFTVRMLILSRHRVQALENREKKNRRAKDIKFAVNSIVLDILFVLFQTPIIITYFVDIPDIVVYYSFFISTAIIYFFNYTIPIFTYVISNSLFRRELLRLIGLKRMVNLSSMTQTRTRMENKSMKEQTLD